MSKLTTNQIKERLKGSDVSPLFLRGLAQDPRKSVQNLLNSYKRQQKKVAEIAEQYQKKCEYEEIYWHQNQFVAGVDEVGRGCLAGPVVCAAVVLDPNNPIFGVDDSKKLNPKKRQQLADEIKDRALSYSVAVISVEMIDSVNILEASRYGMQKAVSKLDFVVQGLLIDAVKINSTIEQNVLIKGDARSASIGAASILAKVYRDELMDRYDSFYPEFHFKENKGYGTREHMRALKDYGTTPIHRQSFSPVRQLNA